MSGAAAQSRSPTKLSLAISSKVDVGTQVRFRPASAQSGVTVGGASKSQWSESWRDGGRATFRPSSTEQGRPTFKNDKEDLVNEIKSLKKAMVESEKEKETLRVKIHRLEVKGRDKDKVVSQALRERSSELPERIQSLIKECVSSSSLVEIDNLKAEVKRKQEQIDSLRRGENFDVNVSFADKASKDSLQRSGRPWDDHGVEGVLDSPGFSKSGRKVAVSSGKGSEALAAARGEIERLQKLYNAGEVVREGLERRISELEAEVHRLRARAAGDPNSPVKGKDAGGNVEEDGERGELFTKDGREFENYIRRLAGLDELPVGDKGDRAAQRVRVGLGPKPTGKDRTEDDARKSKREWAMYEVTTQTGKVSGGGTTAQCYITFRGEHGDYGPCQLERPSDGGSVLKEGAKDVFDVCALDVGSLKAVVISHDNTGESPSWHLTAVTVRRARTDTQEAKTFEFYYDGWVSAEKGEQSLRVEIGLSSRQAKGGQVMTVSAPTGGSGARAADGIDSEALAVTCRSVCKAILEMHVPESVGDRTKWGLASLARRLTSKPVRPPASCRNLVVMLVGPRAACTQFVEWFAGGKMTNAGMGSEGSITVVSNGKRPRVETGEQAAGMAAHCEAILSVPRVGKKFCVEEVPGSERRFDQITFIHPPVIEGSAPGMEMGSSVSQALAELRGEFESRTNLKATFKEMDVDGSGSIELKEFQGAMVKLGIDMPGPRAERLFKALDVSGEGSIEYEEFLGAFRPPRTTYEYDLEEALDTAASRADRIVCLLDPKSVHYNARELNVYKRLRERHEGKMSMFACLRDGTRAEPRLRSHILPETARRLEQVFGLSSNSLPPLETLFIPTSDSVTGLPDVHNAIESLMLTFAQGLLELENTAVDEAHDNLRSVLDACFLCGDADALSETKPRIQRWLRAFADGLSRKKHPPAAKLHRTLQGCMRDLDRGHVVQDDVEGWTEQQVGAWLRSKGALSKYESAFVDEKVNGRRLTTLNEESLKNKLGVMSLGHRKEMMRQIQALLEGRKNYLKQ